MKLNCAAKPNDLNVKQSSLKTEKVEQGQKKLLIDPYMTIDDVAELLQVPKSWIYLKKAQEEIPFKKKGKYLRFDKQEIADWMNQDSSTGNNIQKHRR